MRDVGGLRLYSPSDLVVFQACRHATFLDVRSLTEEMEVSEDTPTARLLKEKGIAHESRCLETLKAEGREVVEIPRGPDLAERVELTRQALRDGADLVYQAAFHRHPWRGDADFLVRRDTPSMLGDFSYEVADAKLAHSPMPKHLLQLCAYSDLLSDVQGTVPERMHLYLGNDSTAVFPVSEHYHGYRRTRAAFEALVASPPEDSTPEPCKHCAVCRWRERCVAQWEQDDDLSLVANIRKSQAAKLRNAGVRTVAGLAQARPNARIPDLAPETFETLREQAGLQERKARTGKDSYRMLPAEPGRGLLRLPKPDPGDVFFDMEGDPFHPGGGLVYLFGIEHPKGRRRVYRPLWAHSREAERKAFRELMAFLETHLERHPGAHVYHYNHYETTALKRLAGLHALCETQLDGLLREERFVDLYRVAREAVRISEPRYTLKNFEVFHRGSRGGGVTAGMESISVYSQWQESGDDRLLGELADYNREDVESARELRDWLLTLAPRARSVPGPGPERDPPDEEEAREQKQWEIRLDRFSARLAAAERVPEALRTRLRDLLEYHNREARSEWWKCFDRQGKTHEELEEDPECIGNLAHGRLVPREEAEPDGRRRRQHPGWPEAREVSYGFPEQEHKPRVGSPVANVSCLRIRGNITDLDVDSCTARIKWRLRAKDRDDWQRWTGVSGDPLSVGPGPPINTKVIRDSLYFCAERIMLRSQPGQEREPRPCAAGLLLRDFPRIRGRRPGKTLAETGDSHEDALRAVLRLDGSHLFIQGPPGSGKTHASGRIIADLLHAGKRVGVSSNSHKAIHNLLDRVVKIADEEGLRFRGVKKAARGNEESEYKEGARIESDRIENEFQVGEIDRARFRLFAGTTWLFSDSHFRDRLDFLFVDEASQVALANIVGMSTATRNLVLVGDQMQLAPPIKGAHPGESGQSVLEFLLEGRDTVPENRGIFLAESWRMRPSVCQFVSDCFYNGRLRSHETTLERSLDLQGVDLPNEGIVLVEAEHTGCTHSSAVEGEIIRQQHEALVGQTFRGEGSRVRKITARDILVVTPYNVQANHLRAVLPPDARVGTIDKFQGQEAPIVLVSMATSDVEDLPRHAEFFYNRNRLNVAISRAQCLAVVVMSPRMLDFPCQTVEHARLLSLFARLHDYAHVLRHVPPRRGARKAARPGSGSPARAGGMR